MTFVSSFLYNIAFRAEYPTLSYHFLYLISHLAATCHYSSFPLKSLTNGSTYSPIILALSLILIFFFSILAWRPVICSLLKTQTSSPCTRWQWGPPWHDACVRLIYLQTNSLHILRNRARLLGFKLHTTLLLSLFHPQIKKYIKYLNFTVIFILFSFADCVLLQCQCTKISVISFTSITLSSSPRRKFNAI